MSPSLTVVLPVHNAEATLPRQIEELLSIAGELTSRFELLVIDDGSVDDTYEIASELSTRFPQVRVKRHARHRGLGPTLRSLPGRVKADVVIVHDGCSLLYGEHVRRVWLEGLGQRHRLDSYAPSVQSPTTVKDLRAPQVVHRAMAATHRRLGGFDLLPDEELTQTKPTVVSAHLPEKSEPRKGGVVGQVPALLSSNLLDTMAEFARGE